jgi:monoamine oxidase
MTVAAYLRQQWWYPEVAQLAEVFATEFGTSNRKLGMLSLAEQEAAWQSGSRNYHPAKPYTEAFSMLADKVAPFLHLYTPVMAVNYSAARPEVATNTGAIFSADKVLVTVPLSQLQKGAVQFYPLLPPEKQDAIHGLGIDAVSKVFLSFSVRFWPADMHELVGGKYCSAYLVPAAALPDGEHVLVAYLTGDHATTAAALPPDQLDKQLCKELNWLTNTEFATKHFQKSEHCHWAEVPFIEGGYSFTPPHAQSFRKTLAAPLQSKLYFAGEACNTLGHPATVHGAMESAEVAVAHMLGVYEKAQGPAV